MNLPIELKTRIAEHIAAVEPHLSNYPMDEQREILQTLEMRIQNMLETRTNGKPDAESLEAIIAEMDAPEAYGPASALVAPQKNRLRTPGKRILFYCSMAILCLLFIAIWLADPFSSQWMDEPAPAENTPPTQAIP
ncbi:hypothetical protein P4E94_09090 [Pontiellaceae bacterium B12219]|nr:hypothetical protein [Pontiellaceae bacterium B12219]